MTWPFENDTSDIEKKLAKRVCIVNGSVIYLQSLLLC